MTDETKSKPFLNLDGNIPFTFVLGLGLMWATYSWSELQGLKDRVTVRETSSQEYRKKVDRLEEDQRTVGATLNGMRSDILVMKEIMLRMERQASPPRQ